MEQEAGGKRVLKSFTQALAAGGEVGAAIGDVIVMNQKCLFLSQYKANWILLYRDK